MLAWSDVNSVLPVTSLYTSSLFPSHPLSFSYVSACFLFVFVSRDAVVCFNAQLFVGSPVASYSVVCLFFPVFSSFGFSRSFFALVSSRSSFTRRYVALVYVGGLVADEGLDVYRSCCTLIVLSESAVGR